MSEVRPARPRWPLGANPYTQGRNVYARLGGVLYGGVTPARREGTWRAPAPHGLMTNPMRRERGGDMGWRLPRKERLTPTRREWAW